MKYDKFIYKYVLNLGLPLIYSRVQKSLYLYNYNINDKYSLYDYETAIYIDMYYKNYWKNYWDVARLISNSFYKRMDRLKKRIENYLNENCLFILLTFTDEVLNNTSDITRRRYVTRFLKSLNCKYVANIDFGQDCNKTMREHYHCIVQTDFIDSTKWNYGIVKIKRINRKNPYKLSKYITKLTLHALKEGTCSRVIYSK